ncbi:hypothetical protein V496_10433 [Pseudogymnoascus sp. VKM F-4515 (FW-2607)]|nr:hypothetical protein V496_10433 [Pseudogymnoascus sp. VKM F-4515 (FW-2607)]
MYSKIFFGFTAVQAAIASSIGDHRHTTAVCQDYTIPVTVTSDNFPFVLPKFDTNLDVADFTTQLGRRDVAESFIPFGAPVTETANYRISGTFCTPKNKVAGHESTVFLASHGLGFDRRYWDASFDPKHYSFKDYVISKGYSIFFYDRLGTGSSQKVSGYTNQANIQVAILAELASAIRLGRLTGSMGKPTAIVLVGHSFGSFISNALISAQPTVADAVILTGISYAGGTPGVVASAFQPRIAASQSPHKWRHLDNGYVTWVDVFANINTFFKKALYDPAVAVFTEERKQPFAYSELVSLSLLNLDAGNFTGPALVLNGEYDFIACGGYCPGVLEPAARGVFRNSKSFLAYTQPGTGHGLNFHRNATGGYSVMTDFLRSNGL